MVTVRRSHTPPPSTPSGSQVVRRGAPARRGPSAGHRGRGRDRARASRPASLARVRAGYGARAPDGEAVRHTRLRGSPTMSDGILQGLTVVVTGVGPGLGREIAEAALREGANVAIAARSEDR